MCDIITINISQYIKYNTINILNLSYAIDNLEKTTITSYEDVLYKCNTICFFVDNYIKKRYDKINQRKVNRRFIVITAKLTEITENSKEVVTVSVYYRRSSKDHTGYGENGSGVLLLFIIVLDSDINKR